jgi:2-polyprenyl-3-methyl-5-hydroxy-6-metoxy-1,4-benzoquinol methylase
MGNEMNIEDELFCLKYELKTLGMVLTQNKLERWLPGFTDINTDFDHRQRYEWVQQFINDKVVLDIASGTGYGAYLMATAGKAKRVIGGDIESDAIKYASIKYKNSNLSYEFQDATAINFEELFDVIVSFETIEHVEATDLYLSSIAKHLKTDGVFIVSTPVSNLEVDLSPKNPYHVKEWGFRKFQEVMAKQFVIKKIYLQLHPERPYSRLDYLLNRIIKKIYNHQQTKISEFRNEMNLSQLGKRITGYQILVCAKK